MLPVKDLANRIAEIGLSFGFQAENRLQNDSPLESLGEHGRWLRETHGIRQFILLGNSNILDEHLNEF